MSAFIELEIQALLNEFGDTGLAADRLIQNIESSDENFTPENIEGLARFLWSCGFYSTLNDFVLRHIDSENFPIPWAYFAEAVAKTHPSLEASTIEVLREGLKETKGENLIARSSALDKLIPEIQEWRRDRRYNIHKTYYKEKKNYLDQMITLRTQQLYEQEKELLALLQKLYPGDEDVRREMKDHKQRYALEILAKRSPTSRSTPVPQDAPLEADQQIILDIIFAAMLEECEKDSTLAYDFSVSLWMAESFDQALSILDYAPETQERQWLRLELLLRTRRFLELLQELSQMEYIYAHEPETFFATTYLRAQALWGIGQKHTALEVLESLLASRPQYRAAPSLFSLWSGQ